jgi:predicted transposase YbfD/YdcC
VGNGEELPEKIVEEIQREANEEIARAAHLAREAERGKRHNGLQDDSGASKDEPREGAPERRHHSKFNSRRPTDRD